jgi:hypothetical protein
VKKRAMVDSSRCIRAVLSANANGRGDLMLPKDRRSARVGMNYVFKGRLALLGRHQVAVPRQEVALPLDFDVAVALGAILLRPLNRFLRITAVLHLTSRISTPRVRREPAWITALRLRLAATLLRCYDRLVYFLDGSSASQRGGCHVCRPAIKAPSVSQLTRPAVPSMLQSHRRRLHVPATRVFHDLRARPLLESRSSCHR